MIEGSAAKLRNSDGFIELEYGGDFHDAATFTNTQDLLTVLDALRLAGESAEGVGKRIEAQDLRRSILSALGIEEA